ncbi:MAG: transposase [bacterium]
MSRPLRYDRADGWYHVTSRGIDRREIFTKERDHQHFLELLEEMVARFRVKLHAYVLLGNHYHLILQTPDANLSRAVQWLNVSYVAWFNRKHERVGPLMQGRFKALVVEKGAWVYELSLYVHLNPVMRRSLGLDKKGKRAEGRGLRVPSREQVSRRLQELRQFQWSSYRGYAGYGKVPVWLTTSEILGRATTDAARQVAKYRAEIKERLSKGEDPGRSEELRDAFALGSEVFRAHVQKLARHGREAVEPQRLAPRLTWPEVLKQVSVVMGEPAEIYMNQWGGVGRPMTLWAARRFGSMTLREAGQAAGGMDYTAVSMAVKRLEQRAEKDRHCRAMMQQIQELCEK